MWMQTEQLRMEQRARNTAAAVSRRGHTQLWNISLYSKGPPLYNPHPDCDFFFPLSLYLFCSFRRWHLRSSPPHFYLPVNTTPASTVLSVEGKERKITQQNKSSARTHLLPDCPVTATTNMDEDNHGKARAFFFVIPHAGFLSSLSSCARMDGRTDGWMNVWDSGYTDGEGI